MRAAERLTVELISQEPYCASLERSLEETIATAEAERYDVLPIKNDDGSLTHSVEATALQGLSSWAELTTVAQPIDVALLVAESSPLFTLLERFEATPYLLVLTPSGIDRIVTVFDLNQPAAHQFAFGLALVVEAEIGDAIRTHLASDSSTGTVDERVIRVLEKEPRLVSKKQIGKWRQKWRRGEQIDIVESIGLAAKVGLLERLRLAEDLSRRAGRRRSATQLVDELQEIRELRNDIAHERSGLQDHWTTFARMRLTYELAHQLVSPDSAVS